MSDPTDPLTRKELRQGIVWRGVLACFLVAVTLFLLVHEDFSSRTDVLLWICLGILMVGLLWYLIYDILENKRVLGSAKRKY